MKLLTCKSKTEAQAFLEETYPFPSVLAALALLAIGDIAVVISMMRALG